MEGNASASLAIMQAAGSRPLIFSQWVVMLDILEWLLQCLRLPYVCLDGSTAVAERLTLVDMCASAASWHSFSIPLPFLWLLQSPQNTCCNQGRG